MRKFNAALCMVIFGLVPWLIASPLTVKQLPTRSGSLLYYLDQPMPGDTIRGLGIVSGWILSEVGVSNVSLYIDGVHYLDANLNLPREDVWEHYPDFTSANTANPGFVVGFLAEDFSDGSHTLSLLVTESDGSQTEIGTRTITVDTTTNSGPIGFLETPGDQQVLSGSANISGWALDEDGVEKVEIFLEDQFIGYGVYGGARPDIYHGFPFLSFSGRSGFVLNLDTTRFNNRVYTLKAQATDKAGMKRVIGTRTVQISNNQNNLPPFGRVDFPLRDMTLYGCCTPSGTDPTQPGDCSIYFGGAPSGSVLDYHPWYWIKGWALDVGVGNDQGGVYSVEWVLDNSHPLANTLVNCYYDNTLQNWVNCYGLFRPDVQSFYPGYTNSPNAGFQFYLDVGYLIINGLATEGNHTIKVILRDYQSDTYQGEDYTELEVPVTFLCMDRANTYPTYGFIDKPQDYEAVSGTIHLIGWAIDYDGIEEVRIYVDGQLIGLANYGWERPDVQANFEPGLVGLYSGWDFFLDTTQFPDGEHELVVEVLDYYWNDTALIGEVRFVSDNNP